jgi:cell division protein FtsL
MISSRLLVAVLLLAVVASGVQVAYSSHEVRSLHGELQAAQRRQDAQLAEHSRLLLERSVQTSYANVERVAEVQLEMVFPNAVEEVER